MVHLQSHMPAYSNGVPPLSLFPGDVGFSWNAEAFPSNGTAGAQFAIPEPAGLPDQGHTVRWQTAELLKGRNSSIASRAVGTLLKRLKQVTKWFLIGALTGASVTLATK
jgi:hypothetical protein